jgi:putative ABC transport system permease protein
MKLFRSFIIRHLWQAKIRSGTTILGIALGIAVVLAIQLTNRSSLRGFEEAIETVSGRTSLEVLGAGLGLDETLLQDLGWLREYGEMTPVIEGEAQVIGKEGKTRGEARETLRVLGVDILRDRSFRDYHLIEFGGQEPTPQQFLELLIDAKAVIVTEKFARRKGLQTGDEIELSIGDQAEWYKIRGMLRDEGPARAVDGNFLLLDLAAAQWALQRLGRVDRLDLLLSDSARIDAVEEEVARRLPAGLSVQRPARRGAQVERMLEAFHFNLSALSWIALLVGLFLIYNSVSISVISRRQEIGTLRALGLSRQKVLWMFLGEAAGLATIGTTLGLVLAEWLSYGALRLTSTTVESLYIASAAAPQSLGTQEVLLGFGIGLPLSLLAAGIPALEASRVAPTAAMRGYDLMGTRFQLQRRRLILPLLLFGLAGWLATLPAVGGLPVAGYAAALAVVFGASGLIPAILYLLGKVGGRALFRLFGVEGRLANANLSGSIPRLSISVAALAVSLSMMVAIAVMIGSFRETVIYWVGQTLQADLYLRPATRNNVATDVVFSPEVEEIVTRHPDVVAVDRFRNFDLPYEEGLVTIGTGEFSILLDHGTLLFKVPARQDEARTAMRDAIDRDALVVSESFAIRYGKAPGDQVLLPTPRGVVVFTIAAVYYDYSSDRGILVMDRATFRRYWGEPQPTSLTVYLRQTANPDRVREELLTAFGDQRRVFVYTNRSIREEILRIFDSTFAITYALELIAIFVAILGVSSTLLTLILERGAELTILRRIGTERQQLRKMVMLEAGLLGGVSQAVGLVIGLLLSQLLIKVINVQSFGWTIQFHLPIGFLAQSSLLLLVATVLAGLYPARFVTKGQLVRDGLREE